MTVFKSSGPAPYSRQRRRQSDGHSQPLISACCSSEIRRDLSLENGHIRLLSLGGDLEKCFQFLIQYLGPQVMPVRVFEHRAIVFRLSRIKDLSLVSGHVERTSDGVPEHLYC